MATVTQQDTLTCSGCGRRNPADSQFCSACGQPVGAAGAFSARQTDALLAQANLNRVRGKWQEAESRCLDVLRADPNNLDAHSLLGDIFRDQGRFEEAAQWYQLALDLNPASQADRSKLAEVERQNARRLRRTWNVGPPSKTGGIGTQKLLGLPPVYWVRGLTALSVVFLALVFGILITSAGGGSRRAPVVDPGRPISVEASPGPLPVAPKPQAVHPSPQPSLPPAPPMNTRSVPPAQENRASSAAPESAPLAAAPGFTEPEERLRRLISERAGLGPEASVISVLLDPRQQSVALAILYTARLHEPERLRPAIVRTAFHAAVAALAADDLLQRVSISVRVRTGSRTLEPVFAADLLRESAQDLPADAGTDRMLAALTSVWWSAALAPASPPGVAPGQEPSTGRGETEPAAP